MENTTENEEYNVEPKIQELKEWISNQNIIPTIDGMYKANEYSFLLILIDSKYWT